MADRPQPEHAGSLDAQQSTEYVQLLTGHQRPLHLYILALLHNAAEAEEVLQNTNLTLWTRAAEYQWDRPFVGWAYHVARWEVLAFRRRCGRDRLLFSSELVEQMADEFDPADDRTRSLQQHLAFCLDKLSPADRDLITRRYLPEATTIEVAEQVNRPVKSIYRSLERIRSRLLECLQRAGTAGDER